MFPSQAGAQPHWGHPGSQEHTCHCAGAQPAGYSGPTVQAATPGHALGAVGETGPPERLLETLNRRGGGGGSFPRNQLLPPPAAHPRGGPHGPGGRGGAGVGEGGGKGPPAPPPPPRRGGGGGGEFFSAESAFTLRRRPAPGMPGRQLTSPARRAPRPLAPPPGPAPGPPPGGEGLGRPSLRCPGRALTSWGRASGAPPVWRLSVGPPPPPPP